MVAGLKLNDRGMPPQSVGAYVEDMLTELALLSEANDQPELAASIQSVAALAHTANQRQAKAAPPVSD